MAFTEDEAAYLKSQPLARIATVGPDGQPDVTPVSFEFDGTYFYVGGWAPEGSRRFRNVKAGNTKVALVVGRPGVRGPMEPEVPARLRDGRAGGAARAVRPGSVYADHPGDLLELEPRRPLLHRRESDLRPSADRPPRRAVTAQEARVFPGCSDTA